MLGIWYVVRTQSESLLLDVSGVHAPVAMGLILSAKLHRQDG